MFTHSSVCQYIEAPLSFNLVCLCHLCLFLCVLLTYAFMLIYERVNTQCVQVCGGQRFTLWMFPSIDFHITFWDIVSSFLNLHLTDSLTGGYLVNRLQRPSCFHRQSTKSSGANHVEPLQEDWVLLTEDSNHFLSPLSRLHGVISFVPTYAPWYNIQPHSRLKTYCKLTTIGNFGNKWGD